ncbi:hypothetical protein [Deinococcus xianganensis]|uniref:Uncharacterized protein n=1 Tax=Deinococcus xianganensis TaxID=1507289 RepID=A0A6I4YLA7_9DEIO|nr:hypothetical protein [Deinococcus xianganensis]MXV20574.1 hypothetical protein [Deinococcus xianganensis]
MNIRRGFWADLWAFLLDEALRWIIVAASVLLAGAGILLLDWPAWTILAVPAVLIGAGLWALNRWGPERPR